MILNYKKEIVWFVCFFLWIEKIDSSCSKNLCGAGKCFSINDPSYPYVCLCPNAQFAMSCPSNDNRLFLYSIEILFFNKL